MSKRRWAGWMTLAVALGLTPFMFVGSAKAELGFHAISVSDTSVTYMLPLPSANVTICNIGTDEAYFRAFWEFDTPGAATTAYSPLPAGTAAAPVCFSIPQSQTRNSPVKYVSVICDSGESATVHVFWQ